LIDGDYSSSELHETIKLKAFWKVKEFFPLTDYNDISIKYNRKELKAVSKENPELNVQVLITCGDKEKIEYNVCVNLYK
jgi:hypothetical protein